VTSQCEPLLLSEKVDLSVIWLCAHYVRLARLSASDCKRLCKALCLDLLGEGGSSEVHRSPVLCGVDLEALCM
jgi:hypothetical protein